MYYILINGNDTHTVRNSVHPFDGQINTLNTHDFPSANVFTNDVSAYNIGTILIYILCTARGSCEPIQQYLSNRKYFDTVKRRRERFLTKWGLNYEGSIYRK